MEDTSDFAPPSSIPKGAKVGIIIFIMVIIITGVTISVLLVNKSTTDTRSNASKEPATITGPRGTTTNTDTKTNTEAKTDTSSNGDSTSTANKEPKLSAEEREPLEWDLTGLTVVKEKMQLLSDDLARADFDMLGTE